MLGSWFGHNFADPAVLYSVHSEIRNFFLSRTLAHTDLYCGHVDVAKTELPGQSFYVKGY
jgi:hypothetical protein